MDSNLRDLLNANHYNYQRLKQALTMGLRRQLFIAVCDNIDFRNYLATDLQETLDGPVAAPPREMETLERYPRLVSLRLNLKDPNPIAQIAQWLAIHPLSPGSNQPPPSFQVLEIERLTRQPALIQQLFLNYLQAVGQSLPAVGSSLILWVSEPWLRSIRQSAPNFWSWHTGLFEFVGEPTPVITDKQFNAPEVETADLATLHFTDDEPSALRQESGTVDVPLLDLLTEDLEHLELQNQRPADLLNQDLAGLEAMQPPHPIDLSVQNIEAEGETPPLDLLSEDLEQLEQPQASDATDIAQRSQNSATAEIAARSQQDDGHTQPQDLASLTPSDAALSQASRLFSALPFNPLSQEATGAKAIEAAPSLRETLATDVEGGENTTEAVDTVSLADRIRTTLEDTQERSIADEILQHIEELHQKEAEPTDLVAAYLSLGTFYRDRIEQGFAFDEDLQRAIDAYEQVLEWFCMGEITTEGTTNQSWPDILNDLGTLYWMISRRPTEAEAVLKYLDQALQAYEMALQHIELPEHEQSFAMIQNNMGAVYSDQARYREPATNLQQAIAAFEAALQYRRPETDSLKYAATKNNIGTACWSLAQYENPAENLKQAIAAYSEALHYYHPDQEPLSYAMIQNNLGTAYWNLAQYEQPENWLLLAVGAYHTALQYRTFEAFPTAHAATQNNLGTAYWHLANRVEVPPEAQVDYLRDCVAAYQAAAKAASRAKDQPLSFDIFATHNNLGLACYQLATHLHQSGAEPVAQIMLQLENALDSQVQALHGWHDKPEFYQTALSYLVQTIRFCYEVGGIAGQNQALTRVPGMLLPEILSRI